MRVRDYAGPLSVLAAGAIGLGLLYGVSVLALGDLHNHSHRTLEPVNIVDLAVANLNTSAALTKQAAIAFMPTPTAGLAATASLSPTPLPSRTPTVRASFTVRPSTRTRRPRPTATRTPVPAPTSTPLPPATQTPLPPPPTDTPPPPPTDTAPPPPTDTPLPPTDPPV